MINEKQSVSINKQTISDLNLGNKEEENSASWSQGRPTTNQAQVIMVDGAWKREKNKSRWQASIAWKNISQSTGEEYAHRIFAISPLQTEAYAILRAAKDMEWKCSVIIIKTDNLKVVQALRQSKNIDKNITSIVLEIKRIANSFQFFFLYQSQKRGSSISP